MTAIYLIRHGQTDFNRKGKLPGWLPGIHLDPAGRAQAARLGEYFRTIKLQAIYSSPLERAVETAGAIADARGLSVEIREGLGEIRVGSWEGLSLRAARRRKLWAAILNTPSLAQFPGGESFLSAQARIVAEVERARRSHRQSIACVSHADPIKLAIAHYLGLTLDRFQRLSIGLASVSVLEVEDQFVRVIRLSDTHPAGAATTG